MGAGEIILFLFYLYLVLLALLAVGLLAIGIPRKPADEALNDYSPRTLVMVPCRGVDYSLEENLRSVRDQDYPSFEVIAIVDSEEDPCVKVLDRLSIERIVSDFSCKECSGKTMALSTALSERRDFDAYVICDSDIRVSSTWLRSLVSPLADSRVGLSTTFPYFNPVGGIWSRIKSLWGIVGQSMMESRLTRFGWGGSLAFRKDLMDDHSFGIFAESVSDDTALSSICKAKGLSISYSRNAQPTVDSPDDFKTFFEWSNRQTALSISASRRVYQYGVLTYTASIVVFLSGVFLAIFYSPIFLLLLAPMGLSQYNNARRSRKIFPAMPVITLVLPFLFLMNLLIAGRMEEIVWRGRTYRLQKEKL